MYEHKSIIHNCQKRVVLTLNILYLKRTIMQCNMFIVRTRFDLASLLFKNRLRAQKFKLNFIRTHDTVVWHRR